MAADNVVANAGSGGATFRTFSDGTNEWPASAVCFVTGGSAGAWTLSQADTNSGNKSASTLRVVIATDQPALTNALKVDGSAVTQPVSGTVTANIGTTNGLALDASVNGILVGQGSTTSGEKGPLVQGAVTTSAPTYTTAQTSPLSLTTGGALRVDASAGGTVTVSGTVTANQGGAPWSQNVTQFGGNAIATGTGAGGNGVPRVTVSNDSEVQLWDGTTRAAVDANASSNSLCVRAEASGSGGWTPKVLTAVTTTIQTVKSGAGVLAGWFVWNPNSSIVYVQIFDNASPTLGTTAPAVILPIPPTASANLLDAVGINFANAIKLAVTTTATGSTTPGTGADMTIFYR